MERLRIKYAPVPTGYDLINLTAERVIRAVETDPLMASYQARLLRGEQIQLKSLAEIQSLERSEKPTDSVLLFRSLLLSGVPQDYLLSRFYSVTSESAYYFNPAKDNPCLYLTEQYAAPLFDKQDEASRAYTAIKLGFELVKVNLIASPHLYGLPTLPQTPWRDIVRQHADKYLFDEIKREFNDRLNANFEAAREIFHSFLDEKGKRNRARFKSARARVIVLLPGQNPQTAEYAGMGQELDGAAILIVAQSAQRKFFDLMIDMSTRIPGLRFEKIANLDRIRAMTRRSQAILGAIGLSKREDLIEAFIQSTIPRHWLDYRNRGGSILEYLE